MVEEVSVEELVEWTSQTKDGFDRRAVAEQLQRVYEHVLNDRRPEAVGATERLAEQLDVEVERPGRFQG